MPASCDLGHDLVDEAGLLELERRQVDAQAERRQAAAGDATRRPAGRPSGGPCRPRARIVPFSSARRMNSVGSIGAAGRVVPADQRLDADDPAAGEDHDRLVGDGQVAAADAPAEVRRRARAARRSSCAWSGRRPARDACRRPWPGTSPRRRCAGPRRPASRRRTALMPALQPTTTSVPWTRNGSSSAVMIRWVIASASVDGRAGRPAAARTRRHRSGRPGRPAGAARRSVRRPRPAARRRRRGPACR